LFFKGEIKTGPKGPVESILHVIIVKACPFA
jgi:hypothetical protein